MFDPGQTYRPENPQLCLISEMSRLCCYPTGSKKSKYSQTRLNKRFTMHMSFTRRRRSSDPTGERTMAESSSDRSSTLSSTETGNTGSSSLVSALTSLWRVLTCFTGSSRSDRTDGDSTWSESTCSYSKDDPGDLLEKSKESGRNRLKKLPKGSMLAAPKVRSCEALPSVTSSGSTDSMVKELALRPDTPTSSSHSESTSYTKGRWWPFRRRSSKSRSRNRLQRKETVNSNPKLTSRNF